MRRPKISPIRWRLTIAYVAIIWVVMTSTGLVLSYLMERQYNAGFHRVLLSHAVLVKRVLEDQYQHDGIIPDPDKACRDLSNQVNARVQIIHPKNGIIGDSRREEGAVSDREDPAERLQSFSCKVCHPEARSSEVMAVRQPIVSQGRIVGEARVSSSLFAIKQASARSRRVVFSALIIAAILAAVLSQRLAFSIARPITEMNSVAKRMAKGDLSRRVAVRSSDEIGELAMSFNTMALQLEKILNEISEDNDRMETILTTMADGIIVTDEIGQVAMFNKASEGIFQRKAEDVLGKPVGELGLHSELTKMVQETLRSQRMLRKELRLSNTPGVTLSAYCYPLRDQSSNIKGSVVVLHDLTEIRQNEKAQKEFVANVSHELRTPITAVRVTAEALLSGAKDDPKLLEKFLSTLVKESERLSLLIDDLLEIAKRDSGRRELRRAEVALDDVSERVVALFRDRAEQSRMKIVMDVPDLVVYADEQQVEQVLANLVDNALKYTPLGGTITISAQEDSDSVTLSVADTGIGIPHSEVHRIFERFYRVDKARSRQLGGTGLGLSIVKDIVEAHGGTITVETRPDEGSTFSVTLPKNEPLFLSSDLRQDIPS